MRVSKLGVLTIVSVLCAGLIFGIGVRRLGAARADFADTLSRRDRLVEDVARYYEYSALQADTLYQIQPEDDFEQRVGSVVRGSAIRPTPRYTVGVQPDQEHRDAQGRSTGLRSQRASVHVAGLTPEQAGSILTLWYREQRIWSPVSVTLMHQARSDDDRYTLTMECLAVYHGQGGE